LSQPHAVSQKSSTQSTSGPENITAYVKLYSYTRIELTMFDFRIFFKPEFSPYSFLRQPPNNVISVYVKPYIKVPTRISKLSPTLIGWVGMVLRR